MHLSRTLRSFATAVVVGAAVAACGDDTAAPLLRAGGVGDQRQHRRPLGLKDTVYVLKGYVKVTNGATLTIPAGTKIVGDTTVVGSSL
jgi:hypothetical protein